MEFYFQLDSPAILPGDVIRVIDDIAEVHRLQMASRGWEDDMALVRSLIYCSRDKKTFPIWLHYNSV